jgi:hypothetical protein
MKKSLVLATLIAAAALAACGKKEEPAPAPPRLPLLPRHRLKLRPPPRLLRLPTLPLLLRLLAPPRLPRPPTLLLTPPRRLLKTPLPRSNSRLLQEKPPSGGFFMPGLGAAFQLDPVAAVQRVRNADGASIQAWAET